MNHRPEIGKWGEGAPVPSQDSQAETTAGKPSPAAQPAVEVCACRKALEDMRLSCCQLGDFMYEPVRHCSQELVKAIDAALAAPCQCDQLRAELRESLFSWESMRNLAAAHVVVLAKYGPVATDSTPPRRDGLAGDVSSPRGS